MSTKEDEQPFEEQPEVTSEEAKQLAQDKRKHGGAVPDPQQPVQVPEPTRKQKPSP